MTIESKKVSPDGEVHTLAGSGKRGFLDNSKGEFAMFDCPQGIAVDNEGNCFVADYENHRIRKISADGVVSTVAGTGNRGYVDGPVNVAEFDFPTGIAIDEIGNCYVTDTHNKMPRKIILQGAEKYQYVKIDHRLPAKVIEQFRYEN